MKHFMMDLETRGSSPGCAILSVGLIGFDPTAKRYEDVFVDDGYYGVIRRDSCIDALLHEDAATMAWWRSQSEQARAVLYDSEDHGKSKPLADVLSETVRYVAGHTPPRNAKVWGNGADFDNPIFNVAARQIGFAVPWQWGNRCYRTIKNLDELLGPSHKAPPVVRTGTYHNALDDAKTQALHMWDIVSTLRDKIGV